MSEIKYCKYITQNAMTNSQNYSGEVRWTKYIPLVYPISLLDLWKPAKYAEYLLILAYYLICWIWLNQCQPALQQYWISKVISLAEFVWINASHHYNCTEFQRLSVWLILSELWTATTSKSISLAEFVWINVSQHYNCTEFQRLSV